MRFAAFTPIRNFVTTEEKMSKFTNEDKQIVALGLLGLASTFTALALLGSEPALEQTKKYNGTIADCHNAHTQETDIHGYISKYNACMREEGFSTVTMPFSFR